MFKPFSCGSEWADWEYANCQQCLIPSVGEYQWGDCAIRDAFSRATVGVDVPTEIIERSGFPVGEFVLGWLCRERQVEGM